MMRAPDFWWHRRTDGRALLLSPLAAVYGAIAGRRMERPPSGRVATPVICVGNFVVGGAGKTPVTLALATIAQTRGIRAAILTRGYGGSALRPTLVLPGRHTARDVGDEALLLAEAAPTMAAADRVAGANRLQSIGAGLVIMDDGFQNPSLAKDVSLLVIDAEAGVGNGRLLPAGPLRAPLSRQIARATALVVVGHGEGATPVLREAAKAGKPILRAHLQPTTPVPAGLLLAYAGIGRPEKFFASLAAAGGHMAAEIAFPDHRMFSVSEARSLLARADREGLQLVTTEKDRARLRGSTGPLEELWQRSHAFGVKLVFHEPERVAALLDALMRRSAQLAAR
jgi:tetraacyldisaccharide 4'-kinase